MRQLFSTLAVALLCWSVNVSAHDLVIVTEDFPPYNYQKDGVHTGISTEVVQAVLREVDKDTPIQTYPWARAYYLATTRKNHLIYSIARTPEREDMFEWVGAIAPYNSSLYKLKTRDDIQLHSLADAKSYSIGCSIADVMTTYLQEHGFSQLDLVSSDTQNLHKLLLGRIDLIAYDEASFLYKVKQEGLDINQYQRAYRLDDLSGELYMAFSKGSDPLLVEMFRAGLQAVKEKGLMDEIQQRYLF